MVVKTSIGFLNTVSDGNLIEITQGIIDGLTGNTSYTTPSPTLAVVTTALNDFTTAVGVAANGGKTEIADRDAKRAALASLLRKLASYVTNTANGDYNVLVSSQFPIQKPTRSPIGPLPTPVTPEVSQGPVSGVIIAKSGPIAGAGTYNWRLALASAPTTYLQTKQTLGASTTFTGLTPGETYNVELNAVGAAGTTDWSDDGTMMVV